MNERAHSDDVARLGLLASAIAHRPVQVAPAKPGEAAWTDGKVVFVDVQKDAREQVEALAVQASLLAAGSLERDVVRGLGRRPRVAKRYLAVEGQRALHAVGPLLPSSLSALLHARSELSSHSPEASLAAAHSHYAIDDPPASFGAIHPRRLLASWHGVQPATRPAIGHEQQAMVEVADDATNGDDAVDPFASQVGGGGLLGKWLQKLLTAVRKRGGGGSPGADAPTHWTRSGKRGGKAAYTTATTAALDDPMSDERERGRRYPEWDVHARGYRMDWCTVHERATEPKSKAARFAVPDRTNLRRALARLGLGFDRYHRQAQGDDIDIDAVIEARVEMLSGCAADEALFIDSVRRRRDLSVLIVLDTSGSTAEPAGSGKTVHEEQRAVAAALTCALHELGDRVALYAYHSQGRSSVTLMPIKRFGEEPSAAFMQRLGGLEPGAYSRLGAAIRHGTAVLQDHGGTPRQLLVVLSDGLAYDHGYEPAYGAADAQRALGEARHDGIGCLCLSVGASTDASALRRVFGSSAHATLPSPDQLSQVIGPLLRSAIRSADVRRRLT